MSRFYYCKIQKRMVEGNPPDDRPRYGQAPQVIAPSMPKTYHEGVGRWIEDRSEWRIADEQTGNITFSSVEEVQRHTKRGVERERQELAADRKKAAREATQAYRANPREVTQKVRKQGAQQIKTLKKAGLTQNLKEIGVTYD